MCCLRVLIEIRGNMKTLLHISVRTSGGRATINALVSELYNLLNPNAAERETK